MKPLYLSMPVLLLFGLSACGGDDEESLSADLQGSWVEEECTINDGEVFRTEATVSGNQLVQSVVSYINSTECSGSLTISTNVRGVITVLDGTTETAAGVAKHVNVNYQSADITASDEVISALESQGTTLQDQFTAQGVTDIDNVPVDSLVSQVNLHTIYLVSEDTLRVGDDSAGFDGSTAALRHIALDTSSFLKQ